MDLSDSVTAITESTYLISSNREKCRQILAKKDKSPNDIIEFLISLHLVLEIGLNTFYRHLFRSSGINSWLPIEFGKYYDHIDNVSFLDKTIAFIYACKFDFKQEDWEKAREEASVVSKIKKFNEVRNLLLHGHAVSTVFKLKFQKDSCTRKKINEDNMNKQIKLFKEILESVSYYLDHLICSTTESGKGSMKKEYLITDFL